MTTTDKLWFNLIIAEPDVAERTVVVCPRYDNLKLKDSKPSGKMYYKKSLSGTVKFLGVDFTTIYSCALRTKYTLVVYQHSVGEIVRATFRKTDCKWDVNHQIAEVDIAADDPYKKIEDNKDNEYNLVKLGLEKKALSLYVYPQNQVYFQYDNKISCIGHTGKPTQPSVNSAPGDSLLSPSGTYYSVGFGGGITYGTVRHEQSGDVFIFTVNDSTDFTETISIPADTGELGGLFKGKYIGTRMDYDTPHKYYYGVFTRSDGRKFRGFVFTINDSVSVQHNQCGWVQQDYEYQLTSFGQGYYSSTCRIWVPYWRTVSAKSSIPNVSDTLTDTDITSSFNHNYKSAIWNTITIDYVLEHVKVTNRTSETDKGYGRIANSPLYYNTPDDSQRWVPVRQDSWMGGASMWVGELHVKRPLIVDFSAYKKVSDFYLLTDSIRAVIQQIDPSIYFDEPDSDFLFNTINPIDGALQNTIYITQKSNVLRLDYDYPAWLAPVTWGKIETLLKNAFNCYWDLYERDGATHLRIEHRTFYDRGGTYTDNDPRDTHDLRTVYRNSTPYSYAEKTNRWEWDKDGNGDSTACRYEYSWMDTQSEIFDGETIVIPEQYRLFENDKLEDRKIDWFSSDIDFLTSIPSECSSDGFAIVMEDLTVEGVIISGNGNYPGQNYELSLEYLQPRYLLAGIYSPVVKIGDTEVQNTVTARLRKADVDFRLLQGEDVEAGDILITEVGEGLIDSLEEDLHSGKMTATVRYENE